SDCQSAARTDRLGHELRRRCRARPPSDAADRGGVCREPDRSRHAFCALASSDGRHLGRYGNAATGRGCTSRGPKRRTAARRARPAVGATAGIRGRSTLIAETGPGLSPGRHLWRAFSPLGATRRNVAIYLSSSYRVQSSSRILSACGWYLLTVARGPMTVARHPYTGSGITFIAAALMPTRGESRTITRIRARVLQNC